MAFILDQVVPWGRNLQEYRAMFGLTDQDLTKRIAGFGDGPACFNCEAAEMGGHVISFDPIYQYSKEAIQNRIEEVRETVMEQMRANKENYVWTHIKDLDDLEHTRMSAMKRFLDDYEQGKKEGRYICHELPERMPYEGNAFDIGLSSHFLLMYTGLGYEFHIRAITEMLRVCKEIRIFPIVDLDANTTDLVQNVIDYFSKYCHVSISTTDYEFQKGDNKLLILKKE